jgi:L-amino acid N-acyltransferase YncA
MHEHTTEDFRNNLTVSVATEYDSADIWRWRNDPHTRQMSSTIDEVTWESHSDWFSNSLKNNNCYLYIVSIDATKKVGICRFDIDAKKNTAEVSINLNPDFRNKKMSRLLLQKSIEAFTCIKKIDLIAKIKKINIACIKCFYSCNFIPYSEDQEYSYFALNSFISNHIQNKLSLIDEIEKIRTANNVNWMDLLRLAFTKAPEETKLLIRKINTDDNKISALFAKLGE